MYVCVITLDYIHLGTLETVDNAEGKVESQLERHRKRKEKVRLLSICSVMFQMTLRIE